MFVSQGRNALIIFKLATLLNAVSSGLANKKMRALCRVASGFCFGKTTLRQLLMLDCTAGGRNSLLQAAMTTPKRFETQGAIFGKLVAEVYQLFYDNDTKMYKIPVPTNG